ncbi:MAG: M28 family peptidase, partial [Bacteroidales bacterium]|nr:M28 family peptidase [Bacteroidales bacterium]
MCKLLRRITVSAALILSALTASAQFIGGGYQALYDSERVTALKEHVNYLCAAQTEGRKAGSEGEKMAAKYVYDTMKSYGLDMLSTPDGDEFGVVTPDGDTLVSRNVVSYIQGYDKSKTGHFIVVGARMDNLGSRTMMVDGQRVESIYTGANGNASGVAVMLELAKMLMTNSITLRTSIVFVAFGSSCESFAGSWYFADRVFKDKIDVMINLDMLGQVSNCFCAYTASNVDLNAFIQSLQNTLQPVHPVITAAEPYPSDHRTFYAKEIPSVMFTTGRYAEHNTSKDTASILEFEGMEKELEYIFNFTSSLSSTGRDIAFRQGDPAKKVKPQDDVVSFHDCDVPPQ